MTKSELRRLAREQVRALSPGARARAGDRIAERVWRLPEVADASVILLYASMPTEVPTDAIASEARRRGIVVTYPRCLPETREMVLQRVLDPSDLREGGSYGLREPVAECPLVNLEEIHVALVPGLAWDRTGGRLGRGAGYYDRLFARPEWRGFRCGLFFAAQEVSRVPMQAWDAPLHAVVTEDSIWTAA